MTKIYFATNRNPKDKSQPADFGSTFSENGLGDLRFGEADVINGQVDWRHVQVLPDNPGAGSQALFAKLRTAMRVDEVDSLLFIHGFNVTFEESLTCAARMSEFYKVVSGGKYIPNIFVFSWPSDGSVIGYFNDRHDAETSGYAFVRGLMKLTDFLRDPSKSNLCNQKINLIAHSMGNYVLRYALQQAKKISKGKPLPHIFDQVILTAADEDNDAFEHEFKLGGLPDISQRITVYFNNDDLVLGASDHFKFNSDRLGHDGARKPRELPGKVVQVDVSDIITGDCHSYFENDARIAKDIVGVLQGERSESATLARVYVPHANKFRLT